MKCSYCGATIEEGTVFCPICCEEVRWVSDFNPINTYRSNQNISDTAALSMQQKKMQKMRQKAKKHGRRKKILLTLFLIMIMSGCLAAAKGYRDYRNDHSYDYQYALASQAYEEGKYGAAKNYIAKALELDPDSEEAMLLQAKAFYRDRGKTEAIEILEQMISKNPGCEAAYTQLIDIYESDGDLDSIKLLLSGISDSDIKELYQEYFPVEVKASMPPGKYDKEITVELFTEGDQMCSIYYTLDGTDPLQMRNQYKTALRLTEGEMQLKAVAVNEKGIAGLIKTYSYHISLEEAEDQED